jgi:integrase
VDGGNPATAVRKRKVPQQVREWLRPHEVAPVLLAAEQDYGPSIACAFALALYAGLRRWEVSGLQKGDVDLLNGTLTVRRSHGRETTKASKQVVLPVADELAHFLAASMTADESPYVCPGPGGDRMPEHYDLEGRLRHVMARAGVGVTGYRHHCRAWHCDSVVTAPDNRPRACEQHELEHMLVTAEVRPLGFHDLRRSHASLVAHAGVSTAVTQKLMRHSDPKLTERVYTLVDVETLRREVERSTSSRFLRGFYRSGQKTHRRPRVRVAIAGESVGTPRTWMM